MQSYHQGILRTLFAASPRSTALIQAERRGLSSGRSRPNATRGYPLHKPMRPAPSPAQQPMRAAAGAIYRPRSTGRGEVFGVVACSECVECPPYFDDQVTGRLFARSG